MTPTAQRDRVAILAKIDQVQALKLASEIDDPWFRAQALAHVARHSGKECVRIAKLAVEAAAECADTYKQCGVRAWEIAALAECSEHTTAQSHLDTVLRKTDQITPSSSRSEALALLLHAAARIDASAAEAVVQKIVLTANQDSHWRCQRAATDAISVLRHLNSTAVEGLVSSIADAKLRAKCERNMKSVETEPRPFFW